MKNGWWSIRTRDATPGEAYGGAAFDDPGCGWGLGDWMVAPYGDTNFPDADGYGLPIEFESE